MLLVQSLDELAQLWSQHSLERKLLGGDDMNLEPSVPERRGHFQPDEARPQHHRATCLPGRCDDVAAVAQRTQVAHRLPGLQRESNRVRPGRQEQSVVAQLGTVAQENSLALGIDPSHLWSLESIDAVVAVEFGRTSGSHSSSAVPAR